MALTLALVGGFVDAVGYITLLGVFVAHLSGDSAAMGAHLGQGNTTAAMARAAPIPLFVFGVAGGAVLIDVLARRGVRYTAAVVLGAEAVLLVAIMVVGDGLAHGRVAAQSGGRFYVLIVLAATAMGLQTSALRRLAGQAVRTTFVTGMLTHLGEEIAKRVFRSSRATASGRRLQLLVGIWLCYATGAALGGWGHDNFDVRALIAPLVVLVGVIAVDLVRPIHGPGDRTLAAV